MDLIADAIASQEAISGNTPTAVIANPTTVATIRKAQAATAGTYLIDPLTSGPPPSTASRWSPPPPPLWGRRG